MTRMLSMKQIFERVMSAGHEITVRKTEAPIPRSRTMGKRWRYSVSRSLLMATGGYLALACVWNLFGQTGDNYQTAVAIASAIAIAVSLSFAFLAAQAEHFARYGWSWTFVAFAIAAITAAQISEAVVSVSRPEIVWNPSWLAVLRVFAAVALVCSLLFRQPIDRKTIFGTLPALCGAAIAGLAVAAVIIMIGWLATGAKQLDRSVVATVLPIAAAFVMGSAYLSRGRKGTKAQFDAELGLFLGTVGWSAANFARQLAEWHAPSRLMSIGYWLIPIASLGFGAAALSALFNRQVGEIELAAGLRTVASQKFILAAMSVLVGLAGITYFANEDKAFPTLAALAIFLAAARQSVNLHLSRQQIVTMLEVSEELERVANLDYTTGLPNRAALEARMREEFERAFRYEQPLSLCIVDIDFFKSVNDTFGHAAGDFVLHAVGKSLRQSARAIDFVGRFGGEEFVVVAPGTWSTDAEILGERLRSQVERLIFTAESSESPRITVSVGIAGYPEHATDLERLFALADKALYRSKQRGRNRVTLYNQADID